MNTGQTLENLLPCLLLYSPKHEIKFKNLKVSKNETIISHNFILGREIYRERHIIESMSQKVQVMIVDMLTNYLETLLRREDNSEYRPLKHVSPTSNICERLFSRAKLLMSATKENES